MRLCGVHRAVARCRRPTLRHSTGRRQLLIWTGVACQLHCTCCSGDWSMQLVAGDAARGERDGGQRAKQGGLSLPPSATDQQQTTARASTPQRTAPHRTARRSISLTD